MKQLNIHNLPQRILRLLPKRYKPVSGRMSVTQLIDAPKIRTLMIEKWDDIVYDVSDLLSTIIGISVHERNERFVTEEEEAEHKIETLIDGITLVGKSDNYVPSEKLILDTKVKAVGFRRFGTEDLEKQLNVYALQQRLLGNEVDRLLADIFYRDWKLWELKLAVQKKGLDLEPGKLLPNMDFGYPLVSYEQIEIPVWTLERQLEYVKDQLHYHSASPYDCPKESRWQKDPVFAVKKNGVKRSLRNCKTKEEAQEWRTKNKRGDYIEERPGECVRCSSYCPVRSVCVDSVCYLGKNND